MAEAYVQQLKRKYPSDSLNEVIDSLRKEVLTYNDDKMDEKEKQQLQSSKQYQCQICGKNYGLRNSYNRHIAGHRQRFRCDSCGKFYNRRYSLTKHMKTKHEMAGGAIDVSEHDSDDKDTNNKKVDVNAVVNHNESLVKDNANGETQREIHNTNANTNENNEISAFQGNVVTKRFIPENLDKYDLLKFFASVKEIVKAYIRSFGFDKSGVRYFLNSRVEMVREKPDGTSDTSTPYFRSKSYIHLTHEDLDDHDLNEAFQKMYAAFEEFIKKGSSWTLKEVLYLDLTCATYAPLRGRSYIQEPKTLRKSRALVNIKNNDNKCFMYSILAHLHPVTHNPSRIQHYVDYENELDFKDIPFPVPIAKISHFENLNKISVNVFGFDNGEIFPIRITSMPTARTHVNLLYLKKGERSHYVLIKDLNKFLHRTLDYHCGKRYFCPYCLQGFTKSSIQVNHTVICKEHDAQKIEYPEQGVDDILEFDQYQKQYQCPFVIYADFETFNIPQDTQNQPGNIRKTAKLEPCAFGYKVVSSDSRYTKPTVIYRGPNVSRKFIECMLEEEKQISEILSKVEPMVMTSTDIQHSQNATQCYICGADFTDTNRPCRDHDHLSGKYRGMACGSCNLNFKYPDYLPIFFHGLSNFDASILCESIGKFKQEDIKVIPRNTEKYISFSLGKLRFLDSYRFLSCSLDQLVKNMKEADDNDEFVHFKNEFKSEAARNLLLRKGIFPYDYLDGPDKFNDTCLPPKSAFFNKLTNEHISDEDYNYALNVWKTMNIDNFGSYLDLYLKNDVVLLADVFSKFRKMCQEYYKLDPANFFTAPNLAWVACLKMTGVQLELLTDPDQHLFFEKAIRGGVAMASKRYSKANHPDLGDEYDASKPHNYILYLDANNLYGWSMSQSLPVGNFRWLSDEEIQQLDITKIPHDGKKGYMIEVTLNYDKRFHNEHNDFPLAPEKKVVSDDELSPYCQKLFKKLNPSKQYGKDGNPKLTRRVKVEKLIPTLHNKSKYVIHYRTLQLYLQLGLKLEKVHRMLEFEQQPWLKPYIDFNTNKRKEAKNDFEKDFFKLMNNCVFGKAMENLRLHQNVQLVHRIKKFKKLVAKSSFDSCKIFNEDLAAVCMKKQSIKMIRPIYTGAIILDLSKQLMYDFYYNFLKQLYGEKVSLIYTDTDSLLVDIQTENLIQDLMPHLDKFDTANYPKDHPLYSTTNAKVIGKMKDETAGNYISEVIALRPKMYSFLVGETEIKRAKGVSKSIVKKKLRHKQYKECLFNGLDSICTMNLIRSELHKLYTIELDKIGLSAFEDKRYILDDGIHSYAYGHYQIP